MNNGCQSRVLTNTPVCSGLVNCQIMCVTSLLIALKEGMKIP